MNVRDAIIEDLPGLLGLGVAMHGASLYSDIPLDPETLAKWLDRAIASPSWMCIVAEDGDCLVGLMVANVATYYFGRDRVATDHALYVAPGRRNGIVARRLVDAYRAWAVSKGCREACLSTSTGVDMTAFYNRLGFGQVGTVHKVRLGG